MDILYLLIPLSLVLVFVIGWGFWKALIGGQFENLDSAGLDVVLDDDAPRDPHDGTRAPKTQQTTIAQ